MPEPIRPAPPLEGGRDALGPCFKCSAPDSRRVTDRDSGYICFDCLGDAPSHQKDASPDCGCAWNGDRYVMLNPDVEHGPTVVPRPPSVFCVACQGRGKVSDRHRYLAIKSGVGVVDPGGTGRHGHTAQKFEDPVAEGFLAEGGWHTEKAGSTGERVGRRPRGVHLPYQEMGLLTRVLKLDEQGQHELNGLLHRDRSVNLRRLGEHTDVTYRTLYRYRKDGMSQNSPKGGKGDMNATDSERLERLERRLDEIASDTADTAERIRERFPLNDEVAEAVDSFLGQALALTPPE